ncbi:MAG: amidase domain-containing protein [Candidatus Peribacteria bacterium]|nr:amidase domain-containing protein [Candidatus Peribacteria bacterium]
MRKIVKNAVIALVVMCISGCNSQDDQVLGIEGTSSMTQEQVMSEVMPVLQGFLNAQYDYVIGKDKTPQWDKYLSSDATGSDTLRAQIDEMKENMYWYNKSSYIQYTSTVSTGKLFSLTSSGNTWILSNVVDKATITEVSEYAPEEPIISTHSGIPYDFVVIHENGKWLIQSYYFRGFFKDIPSPRWYMEKQDRQYDPAEWKQTQNVSLRSTSYNRTAAVNYALNHVYSPSPNYPNYSSLGGDCTNFVSQCLEAGGWTQTSKSAGRSSSSSWYHDQGYTSPAPTSVRSVSWTLADGLKSFLNNSSRVASNYACYPTSSHEIGDIVQIASNGIAGHSTIITSIPNGIIRVTCRTADGYDYGSDLNLSGFGGTKLYYKIANSY